MLVLISANRPEYRYRRCQTADIYLHDVGLASPPLSHRFPTHAHSGRTLPTLIQHANFTCSNTISNTRKLQHDWLTWLTSFNTCIALDSNLSLSSVSPITQTPKTPLRTRTMHFFKAIVVAAMASSAAAMPMPVFGLHGITNSLGLHAGPTRACKASQSMSSQFRFCLSTHLCHSTIRPTDTYLFP